MTDFFVYALLQVTLVILLAPFYCTFIKKIKAILQGRQGPPLLQTHYHLIKLLKKETLYSPHSSFIMRVSPFIIILCTLLASLFVPFLFLPHDHLGFGNIILFLYLLAVGNFFMALGGLDAGSSFGGMGSSRTMSISSIIEPIIIIIFASLAFVFKSTNFFDIFTQTTQGLGHVSLWLLLLPFIIVLLTETARIPVDNPETHLELTMIHEAMVLEQSGKNLALLELSSAIKLVLFMGIIINIFIPLGFYVQLSFVGLLIAFAAFLIKSVLFAVGIGIIESYLAKLRLFRLPNLFAFAFFFSILTIMVEVVL